MQGFLWLLIQMFVLLTLAAGTFFWLGWWWSSREAARAKVATTSTLSEGSELKLDEKISVAAEVETVVPVEAPTPAGPSIEEFREAEERQMQLERQLLRLNDERRIAQTAQTALQQDIEAKALELAEKEKLVEGYQEQLEEAHRTIEELKRSAASLAAAAATGDSEEVAPPSRSKPPASKKAGGRGSKSAPLTPAASGTVVDAAATLAGLQKKLDGQETLMQVLSQERDDWQKKVQSFGDTSQDHSGKAIALKNLQRSEEQLHKGTVERDSVRLQINVLDRILTQSAGNEFVDDLTQIRGIKGKLDAQLQAHGVRSYRQIAQWNAEELAAMSELLAFKNRAQRDQWQEQARALHLQKYGAEP